MLTPVPDINGPDFCGSCWGLGETIREDTKNNARMFAWPCPHGCRPGGNPFVRSTVSIERVVRASQKKIKGDKS